MLSIEITEVTIISKARYLATITLASLITVCAISALGTIAYGNTTDDAVAEKYINMEEAPSTDQTSVVAQVVDVKINEEQVIRVGITEEYLNVNYTNLDADAELSVIENTSDDSIEVKGIVDNLDVAKEELAEEEERLRIEAEQAEIEKAKAELALRSYSTSRNQGGLLDISNPDDSYTGKVITVTGKDREILEKLVMGEAGNQGFEGCALVAQSIHDMYILGGFDSVDAVRRNCGYSGSLKFEPNQDALDAVSFIFDEGGYAVKHRVLYFYAPRYSKGSFHETQNLVIEYKDHKFFDRRY